MRSRGQAELAVAIDGIHLRLSSLPEQHEDVRQQQEQQQPEPPAARQRQDSDDDNDGDAKSSDVEPPPSPLPAAPPTATADATTCPATAGAAAAAAEDASRSGLPPAVFSVGDCCLAPRVFDRRRALATVEEVDRANGTCLVTWLHPRQRGELACRYWKEVGG